MVVKRENKTYFAQTGSIGGIGEGLKLHGVTGSQPDISQYSVRLLENGV